MATVYIDGKEHQVERGQNLLHVCLSLKINLPYFCWHPALGSVGACRQCAIKQFKDKEDQRGRIVMACMTPAEEGMRVSVEDPEARQFRAAVIEWLMVNHPHDCPVCDEGGECHLQDMTVMTGHDYREFRFNKRTHRNQYLGPFVNHEMNRCIACYRCVRFYRDYAGGRDLDVFGAHNYVYFGRAADGVLESEFSGNLVEVCPTGVFTDKTLKQHYTRKWDLQTAPSVCVHCGTGCNTIPGERYRLLRRIRNRYHHDINGYFLCDRGRYGYDFVNSERRLRQPLLRNNPQQDAAAYTAGLLSSGAKIIGIGSPRASLEANFALRVLVGAERFFSGMSASDTRSLQTMTTILRRSSALSPSLREVEQCDAIFILGEDVANTAPRLALALRQAALRKPRELAAKLKIPEWNDAAVREAIQSQKGPFFIATPYATRLDDLTADTYRAAPADLARLGYAVAHEIDGEAPEIAEQSEAIRSAALKIAAALKQAKRPLVVSGTRCGGTAVLESAANVAWARRRKGGESYLTMAVPECNSMGIALMAKRGLAEAFQLARDGKVDAAIVLENDLYRRADPAAVDEFFQAVKHVIALDCLENPCARKAEVVLPVATFAESTGTLVNYESRAQRFYSVFPPPAGVKESWRWLRDLMIAANRSEGTAWQNIDAVSTALAEQLPIFKPVAQAAPPAGFRIVGQKIPREPHRYSGRTAMSANIDVSEPKPPEDPDSALKFSMEGYSGQPPPALIPFFWAPGWNSVQSVTKFQTEVDAELRGGDPGRRLLDPACGAEADYFREIPPAFAPRGNLWLVVPVQHIFGSEELSMEAEGVMQLAPKPYIALNSEDAASLGLAEGRELHVSLSGIEQSLPYRPMPSLPRHIAGIAAGLPPFTGVELPAWAELRTP